MTSQSSSSASSSLIRRTSTSNQDDRELNRGLIDLVDLIPFDVQFAMTVDLDVQSMIYQVTDEVTAWMNNYFDIQLQDLGYTTDQRYATFDRVILHDRRARRELLEFDAQEQRLLSGSSDAANKEKEDPDNLGYLYTAQFGGYALFTRNAQQPLSVPVGDVLEMQRKTLQNRSGLKDLQEALQKTDPGLNTALVAVNAYLNPGAEGGDQSDTPAKQTSEDLQLVIIVAVGVACVAFMFLILAVIWAWRYDRRNRQAYLVQNAKTGRPNDRTGSDTTYDEEVNKSTPNTSPLPPNLNFPSEVDADGDYPDSVITDDIATSLSQYYRSGLAGTANPYLTNNLRSALNDAGSVSSMESYGYSLDGYAPTIATPMPSDIRKDDKAIDE